MNRFRLLLVLWLAASIFILMSYWSNDSHWVDGEVHTLYFLKMSAITFPLGPIVTTLGELLLDSLVSFNFSEHLGQKLTVLMVWFVLTITGLFQWFFIVPRLYKKISSKMRGSKNN